MSLPQPKNGAPNQPTYIRIGNKFELVIELGHLGPNGLQICLVDKKAKIPRKDHSEQKHLEGCQQTFHYMKGKFEKDELSWLMTG